MTMSPQGLGPRKASPSNAQVCSTNSAGHPYKATPYVLSDWSS
jgi:hypothetical protein